ncbi:MAG: FRG domain-containing protein [Hyphomicrobiaceae bacterium]
MTAVAELFSELAEKSNSMTLHPKSLFRGQSDSGWGLATSFGRIACKRKLSRSQALQLEREAVNKFAVSARTILPIELLATLLPTDQGIDFLGWLPTMQHFSAPTRILDWSMSPWVALYFACSENEDIDGVVWLADFGKINQYWENRFEHQKIKNVAVLMVDAHSEEMVVLMQTRSSNERIEAQQGRFMLCTNPLADHEQVLSKAGAGALTKIVVPKELKGPAMVKLNAMNVNARTLFAGADGLGRSLNEYCKNWDASSIIV